MILTNKTNQIHPEYKDSEPEKEVQTIKNKGFLLVHEEFTKHGWYLAENEFNHIVYEKEGRKCEQFTMEVFETYIKVNVPIGNTNYSYTIKFVDYFKAQEFLLMHLTAMEEAIKKKYSSSTVALDIPVTK